MTLKQDTRHQLNLKGRRLDAEFQALAKAAAARRGQSLADFVVDCVTAEAQRILKGEPAEGSTPPARPEDMRDLMREMLAEVERLAQEQREVIARLERQSRQGRWRR